MRDDTTATPAARFAAEFGRIIRARRRELRLRQEDLAEQAGVSAKFIVELERGKPSCQLGLSFAVAERLGLDPLAAMRGPAASSETGSQDLPDMLPEEDDDGYAPSPF